MLVTLRACAIACAWRMSRALASSRLPPNLAYCAFSSDHSASVSSFGLRMLSPAWLVDAAQVSTTSCCVGALATLSRPGCASRLVPYRLRRSPSCGGSAAPLLDHVGDDTVESRVCLGSGDLPVTEIVFRRGQAVPLIVGEFLGLARVCHAYIVVPFARFPHR